MELFGDWAKKKSRSGELGFVVFVVEDVLLAEALGEDVGDFAHEVALLSGKGESDAEPLRAHDSWLKI